MSAQVRRWIIHWVIANSPGGVSVLHMDAVGDPDEQADRIRSFLDTLQPALDESTSAHLSAEFAVYNTDTGVLASTGAAASGYDLSGSGTGNAVPNAAQVLIRFRTAGVRLGRRVGGRLFVPGVGQGVVADGDLNPASSHTFTDAAAELMGEHALQVWSRPRAGSAGDSFDVTSVSVWRELAVLRHRR
jgi:hypothetical protein